MFVYLDLDSVPLFVGMRERCIKYLAKVIIKQTSFPGSVIFPPSRSLPERERRESRDQPVSPLSRSRRAGRWQTMGTRLSLNFIWQFFFWILVWDFFRASKIAKPTVFQVVFRGIKKSFQSAITEPWLNITGCGNGTAQSWRFNTGIKIYSKTSFSSMWDVNIQCSSWLARMSLIILFLLYCGEWFLFFDGFIMQSFPPFEFLLAHRQIQPVVRLGIKKDYKSGKTISFMC